MPTNITKSSTYVINVTNLDHPDDIKNDHFGVWNHSGSHPLFFKVNIEEDGYVTVEKCAPGASGNNVVCLRRLHCVHPSNKNFKRMIASLTGVIIYGDNV